MVIACNNKRRQLTCVSGDITIHNGRNTGWSNCLIDFFTVIYRLNCILLQPLEWHVPIITEQSFSKMANVCLCSCFSRTWVHVALNWTPFVLGTVLYLRSDGSTCPLRQEFWWSSSSTPIQLTRQDCSVWSVCTEIVLARYAGFQVSSSKHWSSSHWVCRTHFATPYPIFCILFLEDVPACKKEDSM